METHMAVARTRVQICMIFFFNTLKKVPPIWGLLRAFPSDSLEVNCLLALPRGVLYLGKKFAKYFMNKAGI